MECFSVHYLIDLYKDTMEEGIIMLSVLWSSELRLREFQLLAQGHTAMVNEGAYKNLRSN